MDDYEIWMPIVENPRWGFVSSHGRVCNRHWKLRKLRIGRGGYWRVGFEGGKYSRYVHRLVAATFIGSCPDGYEVNHKDRNRLNANIDNLEWVSRSDNIRHMWKAYEGQIKNRDKQRKLPHEDAAEIERRLNSGELKTNVAREYGASPSAMTLYIKSHKLNVYQGGGAYLG